MQRLFLTSIATMLISSVHAQDITRDELKRSNLTGKEMDVIVTVVTVPPGGHLPRHTHPGEEVVYVIEGAKRGVRQALARAYETGSPMQAR